MARTKTKRATKPKSTREAELKELYTEKLDNYLIDAAKYATRLGLSPREAGKRMEEMHKEFLLIVAELDRIEAEEKKHELSKKSKPWMRSNRSSSGEAPKGTISTSGSRRSPPAINCLTSPMPSSSSPVCGFLILRETGAMTPGRPGLLRISHRAFIKLLPLHPLTAYVSEEAEALIMAAYGNLQKAAT